MSIAHTNTVAKIAALVAGLGLVAMTFVAAAPAKADTMMFSVNLTVGSRGADVSSLQTWLIAKGFSIPAGATGYFGAQTKAAVAAYQSSKGISPAVGYFGPLTRASVNADGGTTGGTTGGSTGPLSGAGHLKNVSSAGDIKTDLHEGDSSTAVIGVSADAVDGDVAIQRADVTFYVAAGGSQSTNLNKYITDASLYLDAKKLATMSADSADKSGRVWTMRFSNLNGVIKSGATGNLYVKVTPVASIGATEDARTVTVALLQDSIRAVGGDGISDTYVDGSSFTASGQTVAAIGLNQTFTVSSMTTGTLTVSLAGDNPKASQVAVASSTTTGVKLLSFTMKAKNQDVTVHDLVASFSTSDNNLSDVVSSVKLMKGSTVLKTKSLSTGTYGTVTFDAIDDTIAQDQTNSYSIVVDLKGDSAYADGTTLIASTTVSGWDVEDADGASITPSAAGVGNTMTLTATGVTVTRGTPTATVQTASFSGGVDTASFSIPFTVTAGDTDIYIAGAVQKSSSNNSGKVSYGTTTTSTQGATGEPTANLSVSDTISGDSAGSYYKVLANTSRTFTLNVSGVASSTGVTAGYVGVQINSIAYGTVAGTESSYYTANLDTFKTNDVYVQKH